MQNGSPVLRAMYIILVPVVLLIILLNSGWLQQLLPAASVHGDTYSVVRYNFYYFDYYNAFLSVHEDELDELGYDPGISAEKQTRADGMTWKAFFQQQAEAELAETAYYCDLAEAAGYTFDQEELAPLQERLAADRAEQTLYNISADNYYVSYYGAGMNEERYRSELTRKVQAQAYRAYLIHSLAPDQTEIDAWIAENAPEKYTALELQIITLDATPDRETGEIGAPQLEALAAKLSALEERYENGTSFDELQSAFSTCAVGDGTGHLTALRSSGLPDALTARLCGTETPPEGSTIAILDDETGTAYFTLVTGTAGSGPELDAAAALGSQALLEQQTAALSDYTVSRNSLGMQLATK